MPKLRDIEIDYEQIRDLVHQLAFEKRIALIKDIVRDKSYRNEFYRFKNLLRIKARKQGINTSRGEI